MDEAAPAIRVQLLTIVAAVGAIRGQTAKFEREDVRYVERELDAMQSAAHRLLEFLDNIEQRN